MQISGAPDLVTNGQLARKVADIRRDLDRAVEELTSGERVDLVAAAGGDPARLYALERDLRTVEARRLTIDLAIGRSKVAQEALGRVQEAGQSVGLEVATYASIRDISNAEIEAGRARAAFAEVVTALNSRFGDRSLFAGAGVDGPALAPADDILAEIAARVAPAADAAAAAAAVDDYFSDPAGFAATGYLGEAVDAPAAEIADGEFVRYAPRADAPELKELLAGLALAIVGAEGGFAGATDDERLDLLSDAANRLVNAGEDVVLMRGELGVAEERFAVAEARAEAARLVLTEARNRIVARDPFEAATELTSIETQLQSMFSITARLSSLNLNNFLR